MTAANGAKLIGIGFLILIAMMIYDSWDPDLSGSNLPDIELFEYEWVRKLVNFIGSPAFWVVLVVILLGSTLVLPTFWSVLSVIAALVIIGVWFNSPSDDSDRGYFDWLWSSDSTPAERSVFAPVGTWECIRVPSHLVVDWWGVDPTGNRFETAYYDEYGEFRSYRGGRPIMRAACFTSSSGVPEKVSYEMVRR